MKYNKSIGAEYIEKLLLFGIQKEMMTLWDLPQVRNQLMDVLKIDQSFDEEVTIENYDTPTAILNILLDYAVDKGLIDNTVVERDLLDAKLMAQLMPRQSELISKFNQIAQSKGIKAATDYFYSLSQYSNYIRMDRISKNINWLTETIYGTLEITINLSKPEKDPKEIAAQKNAIKSNYPKCLLCLENVGYQGRLNYPGRSNHRVIPVILDNEQWYMQYSPYVYYNEHAIIFSEKHRPMSISQKTFERLIGFVEQYEHYFIGSNADLPIVGGSILSHDHFQGGRYTFPMEKAKVLKEFELPRYKKIKVQIIKWPLSVIRLVSTDKCGIISLANRILQFWRQYSDENIDIIALTGKEPHNTITPIARKNKYGQFELYLTLRNNRTSKKHPDGIFHPHKHLHHIKKENIGLIEVMGLAILPDRLESEMKLISNILMGSLNKEQWTGNESLNKHALWIESLVTVFGAKIEQANVRKIIEDAIGQKFTEVLECTGVFKQTPNGLLAFEKFIGLLGEEIDKKS